MNAAVMADGHARRRRRGRARGARGVLARGLRRPPRFSPFQRGPLDRLLGRWTLDHSPAYRRDRPDGARVLALRPRPRRPNPLADDPGRERSTSAAWPARRSSSSSPRPTCGPAAAACSATPSCRPTCCWPRPACRTMFQAVEIDGEPYWDGGYSGNPTMTPLMQECVSDDTILVADQPGRAPGHAARGARHPQSAERGLVQRRRCSRSCG